MKQTSYLKLNKPELNDAADITQLDTNWDTLDGKLKEIDEQFDNLDDLVGSGIDGVQKTLAPNIWTKQSDGTYAQTITVDTVTTESEVVVDCNLTGTDIDADIEVMEAWGCVNRAAQATNSLTFYCYADKPTVAIPINVVVM